VATKEIAGRQICAKEDERDLILRGYVAFLDPPKDTSARALAALHKNGVAVKILTGDNALVSRKVCTDVGLTADPMLLGGDVEKMSDAELAEAAVKVALFARLSPAHKERVIRALRGNGHVVGFMCDGINDAPALRAADVGISVDTATDIAKESADLILLEKDLMVLEQSLVFGVTAGHATHANILVSGVAGLCQGPSPSLRASTFQFNRRPTQNTRNWLWSAPNLSQMVWASIRNWRPSMSRADWYCAREKSREGVDGTRHIGRSCPRRTRHQRNLLCASDTSCVGIGGRRAPDNYNKGGNAN
jgi:hypothetical protein